MATFRTSATEQADIVKTEPLYFVHCVSKDDFTVLPSGMTCIEVLCREIHVSLPVSLHIRRVALSPSFVGNMAISDLFDRARSPCLIRVDSSCNFTFCDPRDPRDGQIVSILFWNYNILPAPADQPVKPTPYKFVPGNLVDEALPPVNLSCPTSCNCFIFPNNPMCNVGFSTHRDSGTAPDLESDDDDGEVEELATILALSESEGSDSEVEEENELDDNEEEEEVDTYAETFAVVGSWFETRYQQALAVCSYQRSNNIALNIRAKHEPSNIRDHNAICFEIEHHGKWLIMGYCSLYKIPKLTKAMQSNELEKISLLTLKRIWVPMQKRFLFSSALTILKKRKWDKDDKYNKYNSTLP